MASAPEHSSSSGGIFAWEQDLWGTNSPSNPVNTPAKSQTQASEPLTAEHKASGDAKPRDPQSGDTQASKPDFRYVSNGVLIKHS